MHRNKLTCTLVALAAVCAVVPVRAQDRDHRDDVRHEEAVHHWQRGERVPDRYRHREYVVRDWRARHLHAPPRGYQWVNVNGDYVLIAVATGIIADLALNSR